MGLGTTEIFIILAGLGVITLGCLGIWGYNWLKSRRPLEKTTEETPEEMGDEGEWPPPLPYTPRPSLPRENGIKSAVQVEEDPLALLALPPGESMFDEFDKPQEAPAAAPVPEEMPDPKLPFPTGKVDAITREMAVEQVNNQMNERLADVINASLIEQEAKKLAREMFYSTSSGLVENLKKLQAEFKTEMDEKATRITQLENALIEEKAKSLMLNVTLDAALKKKTRKKKSRARAR